MSATVAELGQAVASAIEPLLVKYALPEPTLLLGSTPPWLADLNQALTGWQSPPKAGEAIRLNPDGSYSLVAPTAVMGMGGLLEAVENPLNRVLPSFHLGSVLVGGVTGLVLGGVIDGVFPPKEAGKTNMTNVLVKGVAIAGLGMWGGTLMGTGGQLVAIGILGIQLLTDAFPFIGDFIGKLVEWFGNVIPAKAKQAVPAYSPAAVPAGLNGFSSNMAQRNDLYATIFAN